MIEILIPTYKRKKDLLSNLLLLKKQITNDNLEKQVSIIISDNCSNDGTEESVKDFISSHPEINISYYKQQENIGLEKNAVFVLSKANAEYVMFLGDDDYLHDGYLRYCVSKILEDGKIGSIIPEKKSIANYINIEDINISEYRINGGINAIKSYSHFGNSMSGILLKKNGLLESYLSKKKYRNIYLFIYFLSYNLKKYDSIYIPRYIIKITETNTKDWKYDDTALLSEIYKSFYYFRDELGDKVTADLIIAFSKKHGSRFMIEVLRPISSLIKFHKLLMKIEKINGLKFKLIILFIKHYFYNLRKGQFSIEKYIIKNSQ